MRARLLLNQRAYFLDKLIFVSVELYSQKAKPGIYIPRILYSIVNKSYIFIPRCSPRKADYPLDYRLFVTVTPHDTIWYDVTICVL